MSGSLESGNENMDDQVFVAPFPGRIGFLALKDGRFLAFGKGMKGLISRDGGRTWGGEYPFVAQNGSALSGEGNCSIVRLRSGKIALQYCRWDEARPSGPGMFCAISVDEGRTFPEERRISPPGDRARPYFDVMMQTRSGRLVLPVRVTYSGRRSEMREGKARGTVKGHEIEVAGHAHYPEIDIAYVYYSDDEGDTWHRSENDIMAWPKDSAMGVYATDEPTVAQAADGRLLMFARSTLGRVVEAWSDDDGASWTRGLPNELCNSYSPVRLRVIPITGDLHCVWNQVTPDEIRRGFRRSRLTSAVSTDNGRTWQHFKALDCADPLDKTPRQTPDPRIEFVVAAKDCGEMPANYCIYRYPNVCYVGDVAYITHDREAFKYPGAPQRQVVLRAMPIEWLYDDTKSDMRLPNDPPEATPDAEGEHVED